MASIEKPSWYMTTWPAGGEEAGPADTPMRLARSCARRRPSKSAAPGMPAASRRGAARAAWPQGSKSSTNGVAAIEAWRCYDDNG